MMPRLLALLWEGIAPALKNHLWQSTFFLLLAALLALVLRRNHARARYWLWLAASIKFLVPFSLLVALGSHINLPHRPAAPAQAGIYVAVDEFSEPFVPEVTAPVAPPLAAPSATGRDMEHVLPRLLAAVWFAGFAIVLCVWAVYWRRVSAAVRHAVPIGEGRELATLRRLQQLGGVRTQIRLALSPASMEPGIFGIARPVLIWPRGMSERLDDAHLEAILAHEVCHVRWRDNLTAAVHMLVEAIFWFHPLVWWLGARLVEERERACDEEVLRLCNRPEVYAEGILKVCEFCLESPLPCVSGVTGSDLKRRIMNVLAPSVTLRLGFGKKVLLAVVASCAVAVPVLLGQAQAAQRTMLAAVEAAPKPVRAWAVAHTMIAEEQTPSTGLIAEMQADAQPGPPRQSLDGAPGSAAGAGAQAGMVVSAGPGAGAVGVVITPKEAAIAESIQFDVASFRVNRTNQPGATFEMPSDGDGFTMLNRPMRDLIRFAYNVTSGVNFHFANEPAWINDVKWDIRAKVAPEDLGKWQKLSNAARTLTLRRFCVEQLKLIFHPDMTPYPYYNLVVDKKGPKMAGATPGDNTSLPYLRAVPEASVRWMGPGLILAHAGTMQMLAVVLSGHTPYVVHDETGLTGKYNLMMSYAPGTMDDPRARALGVPPMSASPDDDRPSIFTAVEQLGLKLVATKGQLEGIVIDHVEMPPEN
jgi:uncharacterized protein (TIGR03435 family)